MRPIEERAAGAYRARFDAWPELVASAPGRVNLIGEHTDYNDGFVLPCAIDRRTAVAIGRTTDTAALYSADYGEERPAVPERDGSWADYPRAIAWALRDAGNNLPPFRAAIAGDVPQGVGLSSSAAIEAATALALDALFGLWVDRRDLAVLCRRGDNEFLGIPSGIMDQYAALLCRSGSALFIDCRSLEAEPVPLDLDAAGLVLLVCDTRVARALRAPESAYRLRQEACQRAARRLGLASLRDATPADVERLDGEERRRARHVVAEDGRVHQALPALWARDFAAPSRR
jgi:galactokinase